MEKDQAKANMGQKIFVIKTKGDYLKAYNFLSNLTNKNTFLDVTIIFNMEDDVHFTEEDETYVAQIFGVDKSVVHQGRLPFIIPRSTKVIVNNLPIPTVFLLYKGSTLTVAGKMKNGAVMSYDSTVQLMGGSLDSIVLYDNSQAILVSGHVDKDIRAFRDSVAIVFPYFSGKLPLINMEEEEGDRNPARLLLIESKVSGISKISKDIKNILNKIFNAPIHISLGNGKNNEISMISKNDEIIGNDFIVRLAQSGGGTIKTTDEMLKKIRIEDSKGNIFDRKKITEIIKQGILQLFENNEQVVLNSDGVRSVEDLIKGEYKNKENDNTRE